MGKLPVIILLLVTVSSCFEEDIMVAPHQQGELLEGMASQGALYERQVFFDLNANRKVSSNLISEWDLCFGNSPGDWIIRLNSSKFMLAGNSNDTLFSSELAPSELEMKFDRSDGDRDSTAIGTWFETADDSIRSKEYVYLVDRGRDELNKKVGIKKVRFSIKNKSYLVQHANTDNSDEIIELISRDEESGPVYYSFDNGIVEIAPEPTEWSLLFSKYTTMLFTDEGEQYPYLVTGILLNPYGVRAALDTVHDFHAIELTDTADLDLTTQNDVVGYEWKYYNFDDAVYTIEPGMSYVIRDRDGFYYKLRFIDFYNDTGEKGYPTFEFARL